ncbi:hypothetical protein [Sulfurisphaera ohwakuensis]|uniref:Uncharacterized protein n=1 Tax=Sulfurisphaera ohwakuensis TaxID=69656 RepID=A0A650CF80_SULOH|nr:hypothetical protein [Sulfurisphaera ohwakuensis]MBB5254380.1 hypothetical protein [Sulfurisphaera ohwakuensis]QGR16464.1 hypothetical protein D1869_04045 [Sulfurisphaera ohwakuensis]
MLEKLKEVEGIDKTGTNIPEEVEKLKEEFVDYIIGSKIKEAYDWISNLYVVLEELKEKLSIKGWLFSREMKSFVENPKKHLVKKLFLYFHDLVRGRITAEEFFTKGRQAVNSSFGSNMRSIYQIWGFSSILLGLAEKDFKLSYPEHGYLSFDRTGKQKSGTIPPNAVVSDIFGRSYSFFIEAPRPIAWEDGNDLQKVWKLYSTLRPDMLIYKGFYMDIVDLSGNIPIRRPNYIIEFKELDDWWKRWRYLKGYKPLSGNEWRARWIKGLYEGLAEVLGATLKDNMPEFAQDKGKRIKEYKIIDLYKSIYNPDKGVVISRTKIDEQVVSELSSENILVIDDTGFSSEKLSPIVDELLSGSIANINYKDLAFEFAMERREEFVEWIINKFKKLGINNIDISLTK